MIYVIVAKGALPPDLAQRVAKAHFAALLQKRIQNKTAE